MAKEKTDSKKQNDWRIVAVLVIVLIVFFAWLAFVFLSKPFAFEIAEKSVSLYSNEGPVLEVLNRFSQGSNFLVATELQEQSDWTPHMANASNLFSVVLILNQKQATLLSMVKGSNNELAYYCRTNRGDALTDDELSKSDCEAFLSGFDGRVVLIRLPDSQKNKAEVVVSSNRIEIRPSNTTDLGQASFSVLVKLFPNAQNQLNAVNAVVGQIR